MTPPPKGDAVATATDAVAAVGMDPAMHLLDHSGCLSNYAAAKHSNAKPWTQLKVLLSSLHLVSDILNSSSIYKLTSIVNLGHEIFF